MATPSRRRRLRTLVERCDALERENLLLRQELARHIGGMQRIRHVEHDVRLSTQRSAIAGQVFDIATLETI